MDEQQLVNHWRQRHTRLRQDLARIANDQSRTAAWRHEERTRRLAEAHAEASAAMGGALTEIARRRAAQRTGLPGFDAAAVDNVLDGLRTVGKVTGTPLAELALLPTADLERMTQRLPAGDNTHAVTIASIVSILHRRAEQGEPAAQSAAAVAASRLPRYLDTLASVASRREEFERLGTVEENLRDLLKAIETGGEDDGARHDRVREISARVSRGEMSKDEARDALDPGKQNAA